MDCPYCEGCGTTLDTGVQSIMHDRTRTIEAKRKQMDDYFKSFPNLHVLNKCNMCRGTGRRFENK